LKAFCRRFCVFFADFVPKEYKNAARRQNRRAAERSFLFECFILLGCGYTVQTDVQLWMRDRLVEAIDIVPFGYADTLRGQAEAEENEAFE
jgi:hypothetical protein